MRTPTGTSAAPSAPGSPSRPGLRDAFRFAVQRRGVVLMAPQVAYLGAYIVVYGAALWVTAGRLGADAPVVVFAVLTGLVSILVGLGLGWRRWGAAPEPAAGARPAPSPWLRPLALATTAIGLGALAVYFIRIGAFPLLMQGAEQGRVDASERGGAPLRVLALLALLGSWLLVAIAARSRRVIPLLASGGLVLFVAAAWILTANRAPSFMAVEVAIVIAVSLAGGLRVPWRLTGLLVAIAIIGVLLAGAIGAVRLGSATPQGPPAPGQTSIPPPRRDYVPLVGIAISGYARVPVQNLRYTMEAVPELIGWRLGLTYVQPLLTVLPGRQTTFDADLKTALDQRYLGGGTVPGLLGESYANFGPLGWAIMPGLIAYALVWLFSLARRHDSAAAWALYAFTIVHAMNGTISGMIVASPFPYIALGVLGAATALEAWYRRRRQDRGGLASGA